MTTTNPASEPNRRVRPAALVAVLVVGLALAAIVIGFGGALGDTTVDGAAIDKAQPIVAGVVAAPGEELTGGASSLPPLALVLEEPAPAPIAKLTPDQQAARYAATAGIGDAAMQVKLGAAQQRAGNQDAAEQAFRRALAAEPTSLEAQIGLALVAGARSDAGLKKAGVALAGLAASNPGSQLVWFNRGWVDAYLRNGAGAIAAWRRVVQIGATTPLGRTAATLLAGIAKAKKASGNG